jgi:hypothetical protein
VGTLRLLQRRPSRLTGALAQWQSSGLLTHWFRVRPPGAPPGHSPVDAAQSLFEDHPGESWEKPAVPARPRSGVSCAGDRPADRPRESAAPGLLYRTGGRIELGKLLEQATANASLRRTRLWPSSWISMPRWPTGTCRRERRMRLTSGGYQACVAALVDRLRDLLPKPDPFQPTTVRCEKGNLPARRYRERKGSRRVGGR